MSEIEKLADAARQANCGRKIIPPWELLDRWERQRWLDSARAVLQAMREPSDETIGAAYERLDDANEKNEWAVEGSCSVRTAHRAMIDHLLAEP